MGEAKDRAEQIDAIKGQVENLKKQKEEQERVEAAQKEAERRIREISETPISREEAELKFADNKVEATKLLVIRRKCEAKLEALQGEENGVRRQIADIDDRLAQIQFDDAITFRRSLNPAKAEEPAKTEESAK